MKTKKISLSDLYDSGVIQLGKAGENAHLAIIFDARSWMNEYPDASIEIYFKPAAPGAPYLVEPSVDGGYATWSITSTETQHVGIGKMELILRDTATGAVLKSITAETQVKASPSVVPPSDADVPLGPWWERVLDAMNGAVLFDKEQTLTAEQKARARANIGAGTGSGTGGTVELDTTLTQSGMAADAGAVGERISALDVVCEASGSMIGVDDASDLPLYGLTICGKTTQSGTPAPDAPVDLVSAGDGGEIGVTVCGKNLLPNTATTRTINGVTFTVNADGSVTANGTAEGNAQFQIVGFSSNAPNYVGCVMTGCPAGGSLDTYYLRYSNVITTSRTDIGDGITISAEYTGQVSVYIFIKSGVTVTDLVFKPMIRHASTDPAYEPYKDGGSVALSTPNGLPGIPVSSGGNYTDENGQQWICDEIDLERGVYVQRAGKIDSYSGETVTGAYMSSTGGLTDGAEVIYPLAAPIETALDASVIAAYQAMHTNKLITTVYNDAGAGMRLAYAADTKTYVDNQHDSLASNLEQMASALNEDIAAHDERITALEQGGTGGGEDGEDGVSPTVTVTAISGGHRVTITDVNGTKTFDVMDGADGYTPVRGTDYWTSSDKQEIVSDVLAALPTWTGGSY